jgi:hypothetical protein
VVVFHQISIAERTPRGRKRAAESRWEMDDAEIKQRARDSLMKL